jgi:hypothetical protein
MVRHSDPGEGSKSRAISPGRCRPAPSSPPLVELAARRRSEELLCAVGDEVTGGRRESGREENKD